MLVGLAFQVIDKLFIGMCAKRSRDESLSFPTGKEG
jgi:hypothetical protein